MTLMSCKDVIIMKISPKEELCTTFSMKILVQQNRQTKLAEQHDTISQ